MHFRTRICAANPHFPLSCFAHSFTFLHSFSLRILLTPNSATSIVRSRLNRKRKNFTAQLRKLGSLNLFRAGEIEPGSSQTYGAVGRRNLLHCGLRSQVELKSDILCGSVWKCDTLNRCRAAKLRPGSSQTRRVRSANAVRLTAAVWPNCTRRVKARRPVTTS